MHEMEGLIPVIIMLIVGALFGNKGKKETPPEEQPKPFATPSHVPDSPIDKLKEKSREMYRELQREMQNEIGEPSSRQTPQIVLPEKASIPKTVAIKTDRIPINVHAETSRGVHRGRLSTHGAQIESVIHKESSDLIPKNHHDLVKGIVFSEIIGPPKSKR
ncbi:hypothetical protein FITA111629_04660 [Filibacter tadaridae]|uniref:Uncharacterized protein n=1 Tax=Filibacter tadaridae TaxID=2483811 RepID=A0A3P5XTN4_9BACL|nr:hypothetical protein [Filibacter tadaridae]VDC32472.1 hypothetical protein FILTAD_02700 [Filibacter tadaridae]